MQVLTSPRRFVVFGACVVGAFVVGLLFVTALVSDRAPTMVVAGPVCLAFLLVVALRALGTRVEFDPDGGTYVGLVRTTSWSWGQVRWVGRQDHFAVGSTGSTAQLTLRGGRQLVLVGIADPRHPDAEGAAIAAMRAARDSYARTHPSAAEQLVAQLRDNPADTDRDNPAGATRDTRGETDPNTTPTDPDPPSDFDTPADADPNTPPTDGSASDETT